jgi:pSer/pThr/pTyr-binding forkhead associated (FHA) protein
MKSVFGGGGRTYYMLVHKVSSKYHKAGESQPIIVDEIEIGRDPRCQVRFDDSFTTVSRRHAAIVRDGEQWKLIQLSTTNSTYLNGHHVHKEWYLQNGDEIQLSTNGPKLGFIIPEGDKGKVSSIGLTARLNLFRKQALRPYKTGLIVLASVLLLAIAGLIWQQFQIKDAEKEYIAYKEQQDKLFKAYEDSLVYMKQNYDSLNSKFKDMAQSNEALQKRMNSLRHQVKQLRGLNSSELKPYEKFVYFVEVAYIDINTPNGETARISGQDVGWSGTGFLLNDGTFVTARHVARNWDFWINGGKEQPTMKQLKQYDQAGAKVVAHFIGASSTGDVIEFSSESFRYTTKGDRDLGGLYLATAGANDWAYIPSMKSSSFGGLKYDAAKSLQLTKNTKLTIIGFPFGYGVGFARVEPPVSSATVAMDNLKDGAILTTDSGSETGNSGGPVFYMDGSGKLVVIGLVSGGRGNNTGLVTPIGNFK